MKTFVCLTTAVGLTLFTLGETIAYGQDYTYVITNGAIMITRYTGTGGAMNIPSQIDGLPVISIGNAAFGGTGITNICIPNSVTSIGSLAFAYCALSAVTIPDSVATVGNSAFNHCSSLSRVVLGDSLLKIGDSMFAESGSLTNMTIGRSVTNLERGISCAGRSRLGSPAKLHAHKRLNLYLRPRLRELCLPFLPDPFAVRVRKLRVERELRAGSVEGRVSVEALA